MAARKRALFIDDKWKDKIRAGVLIKRLTDFAHSRFSGQPTPDFMYPHQVQAAVALLRKVIPDLAAVEHKGEVQVVNTIAPEPLAVEWKAEFAEGKPEGERAH